MRQKRQCGQHGQDATTTNMPQRSVCGGCFTAKLTKRKFAFLIAAVSWHFGSCYYLCLGHYTRLSENNRHLPPCSYMERD